MTRGRHGVGGALALVLAFGPIAGSAAPSVTTDGGKPLPDPFHRALPATDATTSAAYKAAVFAHLSEANHIGEATKGVPATASIHFAVGDDGALVRADVTRPSGNPAFDASVLAMVRKAAPFPRPPAGAERDFDATIQFHPGHKS